MRKQENNDHHSLYIKDIIYKDENKWIMVQLLKYKKLDKLERARLTGKSKQWQQINTKKSAVQDR